ncbi:hypothetical protein PZ895_06710 [Mesorhizobium sp. YIM 152430]|uniref:hypothetical protein n=1 Tax=Mesorhizobium sp. YIM 152430 TaxID=3031761 RepID=UPI0023DA1793|nr:hypothetical protein [Mesorhizobium sp. YIM 152430]MDF1599468.1 hypothetical protein [Mesorhizobium sp. YIM 152430]
MMNPQLCQALVEVAEAAPVGHDDWWIIGSAAIAASGIEGVKPEDVDVLGSSATLLKLLDHWQVASGASYPGGQFRSHPYVRVRLPGCLPIETMGDLHVYASGGWLPVRPATRVELKIAGHSIFLPTLREQIDILRMFGRPKDLAKARLIEAAT